MFESRFEAWTSLFSCDVEALQCDDSPLKEDCFKKKAGFTPKQLATSNRRYAIDVACRNSMHYNVKRSHRNDSDIAFGLIAQ
jgi:hypothetical protein